MAGKHGMSYSSKPNYAARNAHRQGAQQFRTYDTTAIRPRKRKSPAPIIFAVVLVLALVGGGAFLLKNCGKSYSYTEIAQGESITVVIPEGAYTSDIAKSLQDAKVIGSSQEFVDVVTDKGMENSLKPGSYTLIGGDSLDSIIDKLVAGPDFSGAAIPEGATAKEIAQIVSGATDGRISQSKFMKLVKNAKKFQKDYPFVKGAYKNSLEGFLFPKTYSISENDDAESVIRMMLDQYEAETADLDYSKAKKAGLNKYELLCLASIIEAEASQNTREDISSVFYNRLKIDMALQSDATTAYEIGRDVTPADLKKDGPYNTYLNRGVTPGPVCNPGLASLEAACNPSKTKYLYFYFTADKEGVMHCYFAKTYDEHMENIAKY